MSSAPVSVGTLDVALRHTAQLLQTDATLAAEQAVEILKAVPGHPVAALYLGAARRLQGQIPTAVAILDPVARQQPNSDVTHLELGLALGRAGRGGGGVMIPPVLLIGSTMIAATERGSSHSIIWRSVRAQKTSHEG